MFTPRTRRHLYCSDPCRKAWLRTTAKSTVNQYRSISGDWRRYFTRLCNTRGRKGVITPDDCLRILEKQQWRCALSGEYVSCQLQRGKVTPTNASIDQKDPGAGYHPENVQLVCAVLNSFRGATPLDEFVSWCKKVAAYGQEAP